MEKIKKMDNAPLELGSYEAMIRVVERAAVAVGADADADADAGVRYRIEQSWCWKFV